MPWFKLFGFLCCLCCIAPVLFTYRKSPSGSGLWFSGLFSGACFFALQCFIAWLAKTMFGATPNVTDFMYGFSYGCWFAMISCFVKSLLMGCPSFGLFAIIGYALTANLLPKYFG
jgi:hypothetical protein